MAVMGAVMLRPFLFWDRMASCGGELEAIGCVVLFCDGGDGDTG